MRFIKEYISARLLYFPAIFIFMFLAVGCGEDEIDDEEETQESEENNVTEVEHALGTAEIEGDPERVVTLHQGATDTAVALDIAPVGAVESWVEQPMYEYLRDDLEGTEIVGDETQPNLEEIAALEPDLIVGTLSRHEEVHDQLEAIAPTVITDPINDFQHTLEIMGEATKQQDKADQLLRDWEDRVADFQSRMEEDLGNDWPLSASVLNIRSDQVRMFTGGFPGGILQEVGFTHTESQEEAIDDEEDFLEFTNTEAIPEMDAEVFFIFTQGNQDEDDLEEAMANWTDHPLWDELEAVRNDDVNMVDEVAWNMGGGYIAANQMLDDLYDAFDLEEED